MTECWSCRALSGVQRISPGPPVYEGAYWVVEHAYPTALKGWLVIVLKRHVGALHELTTEEFVELAQIQARTTKLLFEVLACEKEYMICFAEAEHFHHIHVHVVPRARGLPDELTGSKIFALLNPPEPEVLSPDDVRLFCEDLRERFGHV